MDARVILKMVPKTMMGWVRLLKQQMELALFRKRTINHFYGGHRLDVTIADRLAHEWYSHDWSLPKEIAVLKEHRLKKGARVFDVGAHQCVIAMMIAREIGPGGKVLAFEPNSHNYAVAVRNRWLNRVENLQIIKAAVSEKSGRVSFSTSIDGYVDDGDQGWRMTDVDAYSLDDLIKEYGRPDVIYMDIEGYEYNALKGATHALGSSIDWFIEIHPAGSLRRYGCTNLDIVRSFDRERFDLFISTSETGDYTPFDMRYLSTDERLFLVAVCRK